MFVCLFILCLPRVEASKNISSLIPASCKGRHKWSPVVSLRQFKFSGVSSFSFVLFSYVLLTSLCINDFAFCTFCITLTRSAFCTTYVLLFTYCSLFV
jgi:hypothetical protein